MLDHNLEGEKIFFYLSLVALISGLTYSNTPILWLQRISIFFIWFGILSGLTPFLIQNNELKYPLLVTLMTVYNLFIGKKQHGDMLQLFQHQARIRKDLWAAKEIQRSLLLEVQQHFENTSIEILLTMLLTDSSMPSVKCLARGFASGYSKN